MLRRHQIPEAYLWILLWFIAAMALLLTVSALTGQPVMVAMQPQNIFLAECS